jgi:hypothetical protein
VFIICRKKKKTFRRYTKGNEQGIKACQVKPQLNSIEGSQQGK